MWPASGKSCPEHADPSLELERVRRRESRQKVPPVEGGIEGRPHHQVVASVEDRRTGQAPDHEIGLKAQRPHLHGGNLTTAASTRGNLMSNCLIAAASPTAEGRPRPAPSSL